MVAIRGAGVILMAELIAAALPVPGTGQPRQLQRSWGRRAEAASDLGDNDKYSWIYAVGSKGMIMTSRNAGDSWMPLDSGVESDLWDVKCTDARSCVVVGQHSTLLATSNLGNDWEKVDVLPDVSATFFGVFVMISDYTSGGPTYIVGEKGLFMHSEDGDSFTTSTITCTKVGESCVEEPITKAFVNRTNSVTLTGASFRDSDNGILVGTGGTVILVQGGAEGGDKVYTLLNPVDIAGLRFNSIVRSRLSLTFLTNVKWLCPIYCLNDLWQDKI